jgi:PAS domain-containing protein
MEFSKEAMLICRALNEFQLPRAIAHLGTDHFIAWNERFRSLAGYTNEALQLARFKELVVLGEPQPIGGEGSLPLSPGIDLVPFTLRTFNEERFTIGHAAKRDDGFLLLMPDVVDPGTGTIDDARTFGREEERTRIFKIFHDQVSPKLLAAIFEVTRVKEDLESKGLKEESKSVSKASEKLIETIDTLLEALDSDKSDFKNGGHN